MSTSGDPAGDATETPVARMWLRLTPSYRVPGYGLTTGLQDWVDAPAVSDAPKLAKAHTTLTAIILLLLMTDSITSPLDR